MATKQWAIDPMHSEIHFKVKHLMITNVSGSFGAFNGDVTTEDDDFSKSTIRFSAEVNTITTGNEQRDGHLKSADFFDAEKFAEISFVSTSFTKVDESDYKLAGNLTMHGITHPVQLDAEFGGISKDLYGNIKAGFSITGKINRTNWGLSFNAPLETGGVILSEEIKINCEVQLAAKA